MKISEIFTSVQGEGLRVGTPALFVRLAECNLHCKNCDTSYSWYNSESCSIEKVKQTLANSELDYCVITGGEPLLQKEEVVELIKSFPDVLFEIETNGTVPIDELLLLGNVVFSINPKLPSLYGKLLEKEQWGVLLSNISKLRSNDQVWFVTDGSKKDMEIVEEIIPAIPQDVTIWLTPIGGWYDDRKRNYGVLKKVIKLKERYTYRDIRMGYQMHKLLFGVRRGI